LRRVVLAQAIPRAIRAVLWGGHVGCSFSRPALSGAARNR
jgi:hypothetical protein